MPPKNNTSTKKLSDEFVIAHLMGYYEYSGTYFQTYCNENCIRTQRRTLARIAKALKLEAMKKDKVPYSFAHKKVWTYLQERDEASKENLKKMQDNNKVLTSNEVELVVETCRMLSNMGLGIDEDTCLLVLNCILSNRIEEKKLFW